MKKVKYLFFALLCALILPFSASAEVVADASIPKGSKKVPVYMFRGEGCGHCAKAEAWFKSIKAELLEINHGVVFLMTLLLIC